MRVIQDVNGHVRRRRVKSQSVKTSMYPTLCACQWQCNESSSSDAFSEELPSAFTGVVLGRNFSFHHRSIAASARKSFSGGPSMLSNRRSSRDSLDSKDLLLVFTTFIWEKMCSTCHSCKRPHGASYTFMCMGTAIPHFLEMRLGYDHVLAWPWLAS